MKSGTTKNFFSFLLHPTRMVVSDEQDEALKGFVRSLPMLFRTNQGTLLYKGRNELRVFVHEGQEMVVKAFARPHILNRLIYGVLRKSKAQRSYEYARRLRREGLGSPMPVAWLTERNGLLFTRSYYVSLKSTCPYTYRDIQDGKVIPRSEEERYLRLVARFVARLHDNGMLHRDLSQGNVLFGPGDEVELIDLNRIRFRRVGMEEGCRNLSERLLANRRQREILATTYAEMRGFDKAECLKIVSQYNGIKD